MELYPLPKLTRRSTFYFFPNPKAGILLRWVLHESVEGLDLCSFKRISTGSCSSTMTIILERITASAQYRTKIRSTDCRRQIIPVPLPPVPSLYYLSGDGRVNTFRGVNRLEHRYGETSFIESAYRDFLKLMFIVFYLFYPKKSYL